jgi:tetratricopeptide (TPR) repeat protein
VECEKLYREFLELGVVSSGGQAARLHDTARGYLFRQWLAPSHRAEFSAASARLAEYFSRCQQASSDVAEIEQFRYSVMFHRIGADEPMGMREFNTLFKERRRQFRIGDCDRLVKLVCEYETGLRPESLAVLSYRKGQNAADYRQWAKARLAFQAVLDNPASDADLRIRTHNRLGMLAVAERQYKTAIACFEQALQLAASSGRGSRYTHRILRDMGAAHRDLGDLDRALELLTESVERAKEANDLASVAACHNSLGMLHQKRHEVAEAAVAFRASAAALEQLALPVQQAKVYDNLGTLHTETGDWTASMEAYARSLDITRAAGDAFGQAITLNNMARVHLRSRADAKAVELFEEAGKLFAQVGDLYGAAQVRRNVGRVHARLRRPKEAKDSLAQAMSWFNKAGASEEEEATRQELSRLERRSTLPWWAWAAVVVVALFAALLIAASTLGI